MEKNIRPSNQWEKIIDEYRNSGMTVAEFCERKEFTVTTLKYHLYHKPKLKKSTECVKTSDSIEFVPVSLKQEEPVLSDLNISFKAGEWIGIVGPSESGKSAILDLLLKLYHIDQGQILIDHTDLKDINDFLLRDYITKVSQDVFLFPGTIEDNFKLVNEHVSNKDIEDAIHLACLDEYIHSLPNGIQTDVGEAGKLMSGGERQRLSLAIGLIRKNKILLLDEVTSNLDSSTSYQLMLNLKQLKEEGYTIISVTHQEEFLNYADKVYKITNGKSSQIR